MFQRLALIRFPVAGRSSGGSRKCLPARTLPLRCGMLLLLAAAAAVPASAGVIYSNFGVNDSFASGIAYPVGSISRFNQAIAQSFTPTQRVQFSDARLGLFAAAGNTINLYLGMDLSGTPGSTIDTLVQQSPAIAIPGSAITFACTLCPILQANTPYWLIAVGTGPWTAWGFNVIGDNSGIFDNSTGSATGPWTFNGGLTRGAFAVEGVPLAAPEPGSMGLLGLGMAALGISARRRKRRPAGTTAD